MMIILNNFGVDIYLKGIGRFRPCGVIGFVGEVVSISGEFGDAKSNCGICGGG